jgi:hypothetical protein
VVGARLQVSGFRFQTILAEAAFQAANSLRRWPNGSRQPDVLSEDSLQSEWVMTEIRRAREAEIRENRRKLFPIRLVDLEEIRKWRCFDADLGKDLAKEIREYQIMRRQAATRVGEEKVLRKVSA